MICFIGNIFYKVGGYENISGDVLGVFLDCYFYIERGMLEVFGE